MNRLSQTTRLWTDPAALQALRLAQVLRWAPEEPHQSTCPECHGPKPVGWGVCRHCSGRQSAFVRHGKFKDQVCSTCHTNRARGTSGRCRRCYSQAWTRKWARARRLKVVCLALAGMPFNDLLRGVQHRRPKALEAAQRLLEAVAEGRGWIARSPWPERRRTSV